MVWGFELGALKVTILSIGGSQESKPINHSIKNLLGPYQRTPKQVARAIRYPGLGVRSVGPVGDFLEPLVELGEVRSDFCCRIQFWGNLGLGLLRIGWFFSKNAGKLLAGSLTEHWSIGYGLVVVSYGWFRWLQPTSKGNVLNEKLGFVLLGDFFFNHGISHHFSPPFGRFSFATFSIRIFSSSKSKKEKGSWFLVWIPE